MPVDRNLATRRRLMPEKPAVVVAAAPPPPPRIYSIATTFTDSIVTFQTTQVTSAISTIVRGAAGQVLGYSVPLPPRPRVSPEERARREGLERLAREQETRRHQERRAADERAERLLLSSLTPEQRDDYKRRACFYLYTKSGKRYRIERGWSGNVHLVDDTGKPLHRYCAHPAIHVPEPDNMLAQKLMLETDEPAFLRVANQHW